MTLSRESPRHVFAHRDVGPASRADFDYRGRCSLRNAAARAPPPRVPAATAAFTAPSAFIFGGLAARPFISICRCLEQPR